MAERGQRDDGLATSETVATDTSAGAAGAAGALDATMDSRAPRPPPRRARR